MSYAILITLAISNSPDQKATVQEIYKWIENTFPYYSRTDKTKWQNAIRHNLTIHKEFYREKIFTAQDSHSVWKIDDSCPAFKKTHKRMPIFKCNDCKAKFPSFDDLKRHHKEVHSIILHKTYVFKLDFQCLDMLSTICTLIVQ